MALLKWQHYSPSFISRRYNRLAVIYPVFELIFWLPPGIRKKAVNALKLNPEDNVIEIGCGTGRNLDMLSKAVAPGGKVYGIDVSENMLKKAMELKEKKNLSNVELICTDAGSYEFPGNINEVLFSLSYAVMSERKEIISKLWRKLSPGGRIVIMDAQFPPGILGKIIAPVKPALILFLKATVIGNPYIRPIEELKEITGSVEVEETSMKTYFISAALKAWSTYPLTSSPAYKLTP